MNTKYFGDKAKKAQSSERAEAMPAAIITAIISSMILLGIATVVSMVVQEKGDAQNNVALTTVVSNIDVSLRSDVSQASYITASAKLKQPAARTLTTTDVLLSGVNMHIPATNSECKVVRWSINGSTASRDLTVYSSSVKTESFVKCDETSPVLAKRTKVFAKDVNVQAPFKFNNQVGRPIAFNIDSVSLAKVNVELEKQLTDKGVQKLNDTDFNELNKLMTTDSYTPGFVDACVMNATKVNGICPEAEADTIAAAWGSLKIAKVSVAFEISTNGGETAKRDIEQNSSVPLYSNAAEAEAAVANSSADNRPVSPVPSVAAMVTLGANYTINWTAGGACPVDMTLNYKLYENNTLIASQPTRNFTKNYTNSATQFLNYVVQTDCIRGALVISSDMSSATIAKVIPAAPSSLVINAQPPATNAALNSNLTSTATCLYGTSPRYNIIQSIASYGTAGTTVANVTTVNRAINSGFTVVEGASYQYRVEAWCISAFDKSSLTNVNTNTFSTLINAPAVAPAFTAPLQGASNVAINAPVTWNPVVCATGTTTQYNAAKDINGGAATTPIVINAWTTAVSLVSNNTQGNTVGYTVTARCHGTAPAGVDSVPTAPGTVSYTTIINTPAAVPAFISPADNAIGVATNAAVTWGSIVCPTATTTQYFTTKNLNGGIGISPATVIDSWTTDLSLISANTQGSLVGYTVAARCAGPNANSGATAADTLNYTTMIAAPATPLFTAPAEGATNIATNAAVTWAAATCATGTIPKYFTTKNINLNVTLATPTVIDNWSANRTLTTTNTEGTTVGYTVAARCEGPNAVSVGSTADTVKFTTTVTVPASTLITSPAGNATNVATNATVTWNAVTCALGVTPKYYVVKNVDAGLSITHIPMVSYTTALSVATSNTQGNTVGYAVKARCDGPQANSADSAFTWMRYTTSISAPATPAVTAPINGATNVALNATVTWSAVTCATGTVAKYFAVKNMDTNTVIPDVIVVNYTTALSLSTSNTEGNRVGYSIKARCDGPNADSADSGWGTTRYTTLVTAPTGVPTFTAPLANAVNVATNATVTWSGVTCTTGMTPKYYMTKDINAGVAMVPRTVIDSWTTDLSYVSNNTQGNTVGYTVEARCDGPNANSASTAVDTLQYKTLINAPTAPVFTAPAEGATSIATNATVTWSVAVCAPSTTVQYFTTKNMDSGATLSPSTVIDNWTAGNSLATSNTQGNRVGYTVAARCVGPNANSSTSAVDTVKYITAINAPAMPVFTSPAEGATNVATNATVTWSVVTCAPSTTVKYYTTKNMTAGVAAGPWVIDNWTAGNSLSNANPEGNRLGYTVAARCDGPNDVSASSATDSLTYTTAITAPATPLFTSPAEGATGIATNATVTWAAAVCGTGTTAKYYTTKNIDKNVAITPVIIDNYTTGTTLATSNTEGTTVGYTVRARCDGANVISAASTSDTLKYTTMIAAPAAPTSILPANGSTDAATNATVTWSAVTCATGTTPAYFAVKNMEAGVTIPDVTLINYTSALSVGTNNTQGNRVGYAVHARCEGPNADSVRSGWFMTKYTTMVATPVEPVFTAPAFDATNVATNATVTWSAVTCATGTTVKYYTTKDMDRGVTMTTPTIIDNWTIGNTLATNNTQGNRVGYTVKARCDGPNDVSASSTTEYVKYITVINAPAKPYYTSPAEAATSVATNATLTWGAVTCATGTTTEYYTTKNMNAGAAIAPSVMDAWNTDLTYVTNNTQGNRVGYTVKAHCDGPNADSADSATDTLTYTTMIATPAEPVFTSPAGTSMDIATNATVTWAASVCGSGTTTQYYTTKYNDKDVNLTTPIIIDNWTVGTSLATSNTQGTTVGYTVAARCVGPNVTSGSSSNDYLKYTTIMNAPSKPMFTTPAEGATGIATTSAVTWNAVTCATGGTVQYYTKKNVDKGVTMTTPTVIDNWSSTTGTSLSTSNTQGNTVGYTVEARCVGPNDTSVSSGIDSLKYTTVINAPAKPYYTSPAEGAMDVATNVTLTWGAVTCPTGTTTEYYTTKNFNAGVIDTTPSVLDAWSTDLTYVTNNTQGNYVGYTVKAHCDGPNADSADSATDTLKFTTKISNPTTAPLFTSPAEGSVDIATNATVRWSAATCATGTTAKYYTTKYWDKGIADTTPYVMDNWTTSVSYVTNNKQGYQVGYTVKARCDGPNDVSGSTGTDYLKYTTKVTAPAAVSSWNDGALTVGWGSTTCAPEASTYYRVVDRKINNNTVANYGAWQPEGQWGNTSWVSAWPSVKNGYPQWADVQAKCVGANDESSVTYGANTTKWIRSFSVSFSASITPQPGGKWRRMTVDAACPVDTTLDGVWLYVAANGWGAIRTPGNQIQTDEGHWIDGALGAGTGGNSGWVELSRTQNTQWIDTTANWGASGTQGWGARVTGNDMHGTYWNATSWGNYAYWWYGACETPYATVGNIGSHWENNDGTNIIRNMGDPGTRHNAALNGMALKAAGTTALQ